MRNRTDVAGGCIIRSIFLGKIKEAFTGSPDLQNLLLDPYFKSRVMEARRMETCSGSSSDSWRAGSCLSSALAI